MKNFFLTVLLLFGGCDKIITGTKYNADLDICYNASKEEIPIPPYICTNDCSSFKCPAAYAILYCDTDPSLYKIDYKDSIRRIAKYYYNDILVAGTYADGTKVCNWGSLDKGCDEGFHLVKEERCY